MAEPINKTLDEMLLAGELEPVSPGSDKLRMPAAKVNALSMHSAALVKAEQAALAELYIGADLKARGIEEPAFIVAVEKLVLDVVRRDAFTLAQLLFKSRAILTPDTRDRIRGLVDEAVLANANSLPQQGNWAVLMEQLLSSTDPRTQAMLARMFKGYFILLALNLDPECTRFQVSFLQEYKIYLDSYIVLREIAQAGAAADICHRIVADGRRRGVAMFITDQMLRELHNSIRAADDAFHKGGGDVKRIADLYKQMGFSSDIFQGFIYRTSTNPSLTWHTFLASFWSRTNPATLQDYLERNLGVKIERNSAAVEAQDKDRTASVLALLLSLRNQVPKPVKELTRSETLEQLRHIRLRKAEAIQMLAVYSDRVSSGGTQQVWFVTFDEYVYRANAKLASQDEFYLEPCYIPPAKWLELVSVFAREQVDEAVFHNLYSSDRMRSVAGMLESVVINEMLQHRVDLEIADPKVLRNFFTNVVNRPAVQEAYAKYVQEAERGEREAAKESLEVAVKELAKAFSHVSADLAAQAHKTQKAQGRARYYKKEVSKLSKTLAGRGRKKRKKGRR